MPSDAHIEQRFEAALDAHPACDRIELLAAAGASLVTHHAGGGVYEVRVEASCGQRYSVIFDVGDAAS